MMHSCVVLGNVVMHLLVSSKLWELWFTSVYTTTEERNSSQLHNLIIKLCAAIHFNIRLAIYSV